MSEKTAADVVAEAIREIEAQLAPLHAALAVLDGRAATSNVVVRVVGAAPGVPEMNEVTVMMPAAPSGNGATPPKKTPSERRRGRAQTAHFLAQFDRQEARPLEAALEAAQLSLRQVGLGVLIRHKYLKKKGGGLVRTAKEFTA